MSSGLFWTDPSVQTLALDLAVYIPSSLISFIFGSNGKLRPSADYFVRHASAQPPWLVSVPVTGLIDYLINDSLAKFPMRFAYIILVPWKSRRGLRLGETTNFYFEDETIWDEIFSKKIYIWPTQTCQNWKNTRVIGLGTAYDSQRMNNWESALGLFALS